MKTMTSSILAISFMLILSTLNSVNAQSVECPEPSATADQTKASSMIFISEDDYPCLKSIDCLKENGWNISFRDDVQHPNEYIMAGEMANMNLTARYDRRGNLVESTLYRKNTALPSPVRKQLVSEDLTGWMMIENEMVVRDFEIEKTEYKVILEKNNNKQTLYFDHEGNRIQQFARR